MLHMIGKLVDLVGYTSLALLCLHVCRLSKGCGWASTLDILLLFCPVPRSTFLHWLTGTNFPTVIKYHRCRAPRAARQSPQPS
jgi:hypothetical protein